MKRICSLHNLILLLSVYNMKVQRDTLLKGCWHFMWQHWVKSHGSASIQLPADVPGRQQKMAQLLGPSPSMLETRGEVPAADFVLTWLCHYDCEAAGGKFSLSLPFQIHKIIVKYYCGAIQACLYASTFFSLFQFSQGLLRII